MEYSLKLLSNIVNSKKEAKFLQKSHFLGKIEKKSGKSYNRGYRGSDFFSNEKVANFLFFPMKKRFLWKDCL
jgi:hypothetical protein